MGRKPLASAVKERSGAFKKNPQRRNLDEPSVVFDTPDLPESLEGKPVAVAKWHHCCKLLGDMKVLSTADADLLESYCLVYDQVIDCESMVRQEGVVIEGARHGDLIRNPRFIVLAKLRDQQLKMLAELGLTPSARSRLKANPDGGDDPFTEFLRQAKESRN